MDLDVELYNNLLPPPLLEDIFIFIDMYMKGDDIQKLSVIQSLPQLLQYDANSTLQRIVPKIQQDLPKSSCEFHVAASKMFRLLIEKRSQLNLLISVLDGCKSKDPIVSNAWTETLIGVIHVLTPEQIKIEVMPLAIAMSQSQNPVYLRVASCKILGQIAIHSSIDSIFVKANIFPLVQSLCQDVCPDVRAAMCANLHLIAQGLGESMVKQSLLPNLVELASDDNMNVRSSAISSVVLVTPYLNKQIKIETIVPLFKQLCQKSVTEKDTTYTTISKEYGRMVDALGKDLDANNSLWFLQFYKTLSKKGTLGMNYIESDPVKAVYCREQCGYNLPAMTLFTINHLPNQLELWRSIFSDLTNDSCYVVRKTVAGCFSDIVKLLNVNSCLIKNDFIRLLYDDAEEVLQMIVHNLGTVVELLTDNNNATNEQRMTEITRALLKCKHQLTKTYNWRVRTEFLKELEHLPNCMPSEFIHQQFTPILLKTVFDSRTKPEKSQAVRTILVFLRYNINEVQRKWIRDNLITGLCYSKNCYTRHIFIKLCVHVVDLFSYNYFKKFFIEHLLKLGDDPISNIRYCVVDLLPLLHASLVLPEDRKLQAQLENLVSKIEITEKNKYVKDLLKIRKQQLKANMKIGHDQIVEKFRIDEENQIAQGKAIAKVQHHPNDDHVTKRSSRDNLTKNQSTQRSTSAPPQPSRTSSNKQQTILPNSHDMSFLEQHFYIDAGINLPQYNLDLASSASTVSVVVDDLDNLRICDDEISTVSIENVSKIDPKQLQQTTNITDDVKVNLRRMKQQNSKLVSPKIRTNKRHSTILTTTTTTNQENNRKIINRRSLNISSSGLTTTTTEMSKIPICLKKSKSNADVKRIDRRPIKETDDKKSIKQRPKSEIFLNNGNIDKILIGNVPIKDSIKDMKPSGLPVLKKRSQSSVRK